MCSSYKVQAALKIFCFPGNKEVRRVWVEVFYGMVWVLWWPHKVATPTTDATGDGGTEECIHVYRFPQLDSHHKFPGNLCIGSMSKGAYFETTVTFCSKFCITAKIYLQDF